MMRPHIDNINNPFGCTSVTRPSWETARPQPPPRRRANSLQPVSTPSTTNVRQTRRSLFNTTVVCIISCPFYPIYLVYREKLMEFQKTIKLCENRNNMEQMWLLLIQEISRYKLTSLIQ